MNNSTQERGVWGALWHIAWTNLPAARGSAEWTQLGGWCGARAGAPWRQTDTAKELRQRKKKSTAHKHSNTHSHVLPFRFHTLVFPFLIKERRVPVKDMPPPGASCSSCRLRVCVSLVFLLCFFFSWLSLFGICRLAPCACPCCVPPPTPTPSMTRASHSARWTSRLANLPYTPFMRSWSCHCFEKTNGISATWQLCTNTFWSFGYVLRAIRSIITTLENLTKGLSFIYLQVLIEGDRK